MFHLGLIITIVFTGIIAVVILTEFPILLCVLGAIIGMMFMQFAK